MALIEFIIAMGEGYDKSIIDFQTSNFELENIELLIINSIKQLFYQISLLNASSTFTGKKLSDYKLTMKHYDNLMKSFEENTLFSEHTLLKICVKLFSYIKNVGLRKVKYLLFCKEREKLLREIDEKKLIHLNFEHAVISEESLVCYKFLKSICCDIEIIRSDGSLEVYYFQTPSKCYYLSELSKEKFLLKVDRDSPDTKLAGLYDELEYFETEMNHNEKIFKKSYFLYSCFGSGNSFYLQFFMLIFSFSINILLAFDLNVHINVKKGIYNGKYFYYVKTFSICELILTVVAFFFYLILTYPLQLKLCRRRYFDENPEKIGNLSVLNQLYIELGQSFFFQPDVIVYIYHIFCISSALSISDGFYGLDLLAVVNLSPILLYVLQAITGHISHLGATIGLAISVVFGYSIFIYVFFFKDINDNSSLCPNLYVCFFSIIDQAFTNGQGTAGIFRPLRFQNGNFGRFYAKFFIDLSFYLVCNVVFLNIIFGIIIDTFGEMRQINQTFGFIYEFFFLKFVLPLKFYINLLKYIHYLVIYFFFIKKNMIQKIIALFVILKNIDLEKLEKNFCFI